MKYLSIALLILSLSARTAADAPSRIRPLDAWASESFERAFDRSALVRDMVRQIESSNLVIHIETMSPMPMGIGGATRLVTSAGGYRYVRISVVRDLHPNQRAAILGHELQHACELAASSAGDDQTVRELFETMGQRVSGRGVIFETRAAVAAGQQVWAELRSGKAERGK